MKEHAYPTSRGAKGIGISKNYPGIEEEYEQALRSSYLHGRQPYYLESPSTEIHFKEATGGVVVANYLHRSIVIPASAETKVTIDFPYNIPETDFSDNDLVIAQFKVNEVDRTADLNTITTKRDMMRIVNRSITLVGSPKYEIERRGTRKLYPSVDRSWIIENGCVSRNTTYDLTFSVSMIVQLSSIGTPQEFQLVDTADPQRRIWKHNGILFPKQGVKIVAFPVAALFR